ncbi:MAG: hypothetical protein A2289_07105 [Deltaproteobacteria bacterium RIFOXYA12_FULL_58_15]|nr:MAG: hypothetical protein A2289_07105 [Deltaproteobacteria bacterium RIFOXYA12_FULL_58_15]
MENGAVVFMIQVSYELVRNRSRAHPGGASMNRVKKIRTHVATAVFALTWLLTTTVWAAGGKPAEKLVAVADTRDVAPGLSKFIADVYNDNLLLFGVLVVVTMASMGAILGFFFDKAIGLLGINLGKLDHHE